MPDPLLSTLRRRMTKSKSKGKAKSPPRGSISSMSEVSSCSSDESTQESPTPQTPPPLPDQPAYSYNHFPESHKATSPPLPPRPSTSPPTQSSPSTPRVVVTPPQYQKRLPQLPDTPLWRTQMLDLVSPYQEFVDSNPDNFTATTTAKAHHKAVLSRLSDARTSEREALAILRAYLDQIHSVQPRRLGTMHLMGE